MKPTFILLAWFFAGCYGTAPQKTGLEGKLMPSFDLLLSDSLTHLNANNIPYGLPIVMFYFGPHCPYSRAEMDNILANIEDLKHIRFYVFTNWPFTDMQQFYKDYQLQKYNNIIAGEDYTNFFGEYFNTPGVPYTAIYNKNKQLKKAFIGKIDAKLIKEIAEE